MRPSDILSVGDVVDRLDEFDSIIDARSPAEFEDDHLPGAGNAPVLSDDERARVGTIYKQQSGFDAKRVGAALVSRNIARLLETRFVDKPRDWAPLVYCWRGGNRSSALALVLAKVGWRPMLLEGGYKAFRHRVIEDLERLPLPLRFLVVAGRTGSGKSLLLAKLAEYGAQVLDLEAIARHRGSVLGRLPEEGQPAQRRFETELWAQLRRFDPCRPVFVESESRRIGSCHLPEALMRSMRAGQCLIVQASLSTRVALLLSEYEHFVKAPEVLHDSLGRLTALHGHQTIDRWRDLLRTAAWTPLVSELLELHYDPAYDRSMARNYVRIGEAEAVELRAAGEDAITEAAKNLLRIGSAQA